MNIDISTPKNDPIHNGILGEEGGDIKEPFLNPKGANPTAATGGEGGNAEDSSPSPKNKPGPKIEDDGSEGSDPISPFSRSGRW